MKYTDEVAVFWDYENCPVPTNTSGYAIVNNIRFIAQTFGSVKSFKAYLEVTEQAVSRAVHLSSELQSSGVSLTDCPHNGRKDVADKMIIVDMLAYAIDNPVPSTIVLISGDRDFAYALSILRFRRYRIVLITLTNAHQSLRAQASISFDWVSDVLELVDPTLSHHLTSPGSPRRGKTSLPPAHDKFYSDFNKGHNPSRYPFQESYDEKSASNVGFTNYFQEETRHRQIPRTPPKHETRHDFLPPDLEHSQSAASTMAQVPRQELYAHLSQLPIVHALAVPNSSRTTPVPNMSTGDMSPTLGTLRGSASLPNLVQHEVASITTEPVSLNSAMQILAEPDLRGSAPSFQQSPFSLINAETQILSPPGHSNISPPPNVTTPISTSVPSLILPSLPSAAAVSAVLQNPVKTAAPLQSTPFPIAPDKFKILIRCLKSHRSKGSLRPLRSKIAIEVACNGTTYRQAGVVKFGQYVAMAEKAGIVEMGGSESTAWIGLKAPWYDVRLS